ncbi:MAG: hypothetical protein ACPGU7_08560 [Gammaproteobacteria bacterium]
MSALALLGMSGVCVGAVLLSVDADQSRSAAEAQSQMLRAKLEGLESSLSASIQKVGLRQGDGRYLQSGWVTRVYDGGDGLLPAEDRDDVGVFVIDERRFHLGAHGYHGIEGAGPAAYRMNAFLSARKAGYHQVGLKLDYQGPVTTYAPHCDVRVALAGEELLRGRVNFAETQDHEAQLVGGTSLEAGLHPVEVTLGCAAGHAMVADAQTQALYANLEQQVLIEVISRQPGETRLRTDGRDFVHAVSLDEAGARPAFSL